jgi:hypothetical protein
MPFEIPETTESIVGLSGKRFSDTREVRQFELLTSTQANLFDTEICFTPKEEAEIFRSLIDLKLGNYKTFHTTEELFADLDR